MHASDRSFLPMKLAPNDLERVATLFRAFSEPTRLAIIQEMKDGEKSVSEIVEALTTTQANVSKQLRLLYETGILTRRKEGTSVLYAIADPMVFELCRLVCDKLNRDLAKPKRLKF